MTRPAQTIHRSGALVDGKYRIVGHLSSGGMGDVYAAEHTYTRRRVALKVMRHRFDGAEARFVREAEAVSAVDHPGVVEMLDAGRAPDGTWYAVFELLEGDDLETLLLANLVRPGVLVRIIARLLEALAATHAEGYVHRDVKPANIFVGRDRAGAEQIKLLDFGIAERVGEDGVPSLGERVGTLEYMSPEQAAGEHVDGRTDLWSVGALMFRVLTGRPVVTGGHPAETLRRILYERPMSVGEVRSDLPEDLVDIVDTALRRDPRDRWQSAEDMAQALLMVDTSELADLPRPSELRRPAPPVAVVTDRDICLVPTIDIAPVRAAR